MDTVARFALELEDVPSGLEEYDLLVTGLKGGHSGLDILQGRANAIKILARAFKELKGIQFFISSINGGSKRNAIPREAEASICLNKSELAKAENILKEFEKKLISEYRVSDGGLKIEFNKSISENKKVFTKSFSEKIINTLLALPHGAISMSQDIPDLVETSTNIATITTFKDELVIGTSQRSSIESAKKYISQNVTSVFQLAGAKTESGDGYPGWKPNLDSKILNLSKNVFKELYNKEAEIKAIHAGLECGILGDKNPGMDMVSFGPTIQGAHSPDERVNIETVEKFYLLLKAILKKLAVQSKN